MSQSTLLELVKGQHDKVSLRVLAIMDRLTKRGIIPGNYGIVARKHLMMIATAEGLSLELLDHGLSKLCQLRLFDQKGSIIWTTELYGDHCLDIGLLVL